jgi:methyl-accepting chemotaxis protein
MSRDIAIVPGRSSADMLRAALIGRSISIDTGLRDVIALFRAESALEALPVVDSNNRPVGAVLERDIRRLLLNPYGHALLANPSLYRGIHGFVSTPPVAEIGVGLGPMFALISEGGGHEMLIVTERGRFLGTISARTLLRMAADREAALAAGRAERLRRIAVASEAMRGAATRMSGDLGGASSALEDAALAMNQRATDAGAMGLSMMTAATQAADNIGAIAEQGRTLVGELEHLGQEVTEARSSTTRVAQLIEQGSVRARQLDTATKEIGAVVESIDGIARRINLLALNATIEAARAGEAGRGFAVVASEVKALAQQTRDSARLIATRIGGVRAGVDDVAAGQAGIEAAIAALEGLASSIDEAVVRNRAAGAMISANVRDAAGANEHIRGEAAELSATASDAAKGSDQMIGIARSLMAGAGRLHERLDRFLEEIEMA